jgi:hypothetical protein
VRNLLAALRADPKLASVVAVYEKDLAESGRRLGKNGLKAKGGKLFALFTQGTLVLKLPNERVAFLDAEGVGRPFDLGHGRLMKGWLTVTSTRTSWVELAVRALGPHSETERMQRHYSTAQQRRCAPRSVRSSRS